MFMRATLVALATVVLVCPFATAATKTFTITAQQFSYSTNPSPFVVNQGDTVTLNIGSADVTHGFAMPDYGINLVLNPHEQVTVTFVASMPGTFTFFCTVVCGVGHPDMNSTMTVLAAAAPPSVTGFTPKSGPPAGGTVVAITGTNFQNGAAVAFGNLPAVSTTVNSATSISAIAPAHAAGTVTVTVTNPDGQTATAGTYAYTAQKRRSVKLR